MPHSHLLLKLECLGIKGDLLRWLKYFLTKRYQRVIINGSFSNWLPVLSGVPQRSVLGPLLFLLYIDDIYQSISHSSVLMFADDIALYKEIVSSSDQDMLQADLSKVFEWSRKWQLNLNPSKCETICISYKRSPPPASYRLNNHLLSTKSVVRYLGVFINSHLKWSDHIKYTAAKANRSLNILRHSLYTCPSSVKAVVYKCIVRPILEYASPVWYLHSSGDIKQLENVQCRAARWVCRSHWNPACKQWSRSSDCCLDQLEWPSLHQRQNYFTICQVHNILHHQSAISSSRYFSAVNRHSNPSAIDTSISTIDAYRFFLFHQLTFPLEQRTFQ